MKNIHVVPTDKPSRLRYFCGKLEIMYAIPKKSDITFQNIYITSDEEIKDGDWCLDIDNEIVKYDEKRYNMLFHNICKKIILTTDQDLIKDGVQAIDDEFLEWFVKNPSCEWVGVDLVPVNEFGSEITVNGYGFDKFNYKIIIPKAEPNCCIGSNGVSDPTLNEVQLNQPKQETLGKTAVEWLVDKMLYIDNEYDMKLITKSEYQFKRRDIIKQAKEMEIKQKHESIEIQVAILKDTLEEMMTGFDSEENKMDFILDICNGYKKRISN